MEVIRQSGRGLQSLLDLLFPPHCAGCQRSGHLLCPACWTAIQPLIGLRCQHCSSPISSTDGCPACRYHRLHLNGLRAVSLYQEPLRSCIHALKYHSNTRLAEPLGRLLAQTCLDPLIQADSIIPVPLHSERQRQRGFNQAHLLASICATQLGIALQTNILIRTRATADQVHMTAHERQQNVAGAFSCTPTLPASALQGQRVIVIDDVCTTGATLEACAAPLFAAGAHAVWGLVLARPH